MKNIMVSVQDISKQSYVTERIFEYNDFSNIIKERISTNAKIIFDKYGIPEEYQVIMVDINRFKIKATEHISGFPFDWKQAYMDCDGTKTIVHVHTPWTMYESNLVNDNVTISSEYKIIKAKEVRKFYKKLVESGYQTNYLSALFELFEVVKEKQKDASNKLLKICN